ncbi:protein kinase family protein [Speluncibacter jeojiensis]|uniref:Protein kinase family protein n=1 Tax=Speluncibacter jeojiensis TaxID=2710754 RepID=A0A9X4M4Y0_9ACTN|nr:protein kinase family protein [Corynebacteriales bacterium D3-21]
MQTKERGEDKPKPLRVPPVLTMPEAVGAESAEGPLAGAPEPVSPLRQESKPAAQTLVDNPADTPAARPAGETGRVMVPGAMLPGGRYRLIERIGDQAQCWRGRDTLMGRDVALTRLALSRPDPVVAHRIGARTARASAADNGRSVARVFDVVETPLEVVVVAEWIPGWSVLDVAESGPGAAGVARALVGLARAGAEAHAVGAVLGLGDPARLRIDDRGRVVLAFPGVSPEADRAGDLRGIGAVLYALTARVWPEDEGRDPTPPRRLYPEVPMRLSALAVDALGGRVAGIATVVATLESCGTSDGDLELADIELNELETDGAPDPAGRAQAPGKHADEPTGGPAAATPDAATADTPVAETAVAGTADDAHKIDADELDAEDEAGDADLRSSWRAALIAGIAVVLTLATIAWLDWSPPKPDNPPARSVAAVHPAAHAKAPMGPAVPALTPPPPPPVVPVAAAVYSPQKFPDDAADAGLAIDQNPATAWTTDPYHQQLPAFKNGVGLILTLPDAFDPHSVTITSPTPGTHVEIRTAPGPTGDLAQTQVLGTAALSPGVTTIPLTPGAPVNSLLVWIDGLGRVGDFFQSSIQDITVGR